MEPLRIQVWSDIVCPWCYVGKRRLEAALRRYPHPVEVTWKAFELDPDASSARADVQPVVERLATKYRRSQSESAAMLNQMTATAAAEGLDFHFDKMLSGNTFDAHRILHLAKVRGIQDAVKERLMRGYFTDGEFPSDHDALIRLATEAGLDADEVRRVLESDTYAKEVRADEAEARQIGISGVPFFVIDGKLGVSGAQSPDALLAALQKAHPAATDGESCGPEGCA